MNEGNSGISEWVFHFGNDQICLAAAGQTATTYEYSVTDPSKGVINQLIEIGGPGNDIFVFHSSFGRDTILDVNAKDDTIERDHLANAQTLQQMAADITADTHGHAVIDLGHQDSITPLQLQQILHHGHSLLH
jgi:hypothetical protein